MSIRTESYLVGLVGDGVTPSLTPPMHEREGDVQGLRYLYRPIDLLELGLTDSFRLFDQPEKSYSWWDYRMLGYQKNRGLRIDHILVSQPLVPRVRSSTIDRVPRKWEKPSDHAPVVLELGPVA